MSKSKDERDDVMDAILQASYVRQVLPHIQSIHKDHYSTFKARFMYLVMLKTVTEKEIQDWIMDTLRKTCTLVLILPDTYNNTTITHVFVEVSQATYINSLCKKRFTRNEFHVAKLRLGARKETFIEIFNSAIPDARFISITQAVVNTDIDDQELVTSATTSVETLTSSLERIKVSVPTSFETERSNISVDEANRMMQQMINAEKVSNQKLETANKRISILQEKLDYERGEMGRWCGRFEQSNDTIDVEDYQKLKEKKSKLKDKVRSRDEVIRVLNYNNSEDRQKALLIDSFIEDLEINIDNLKRIIMIDEASRDIEAKLFECGEGLSALRKQLHEIKILRDATCREKMTIEL